MSWATTPATFGAVKLVPLQDAQPLKAWDS